MLRLLGLIAAVGVCLEAAAPWWLLWGTILLVAWVSLKPALLPKSHRLLRWHREQSSITDDGITLLNAIPLIKAVYCVNCDLITNSPHDVCEVCGSRSVMAVSRLWRGATPAVPTKPARYRISFTADVRDIPAHGLNESTRLISRLAELGGEVKALHIRVEPVFRGDTMLGGPGVRPLIPLTPTSAREHVRRRAS